MRLVQREQLGYGLVGDATNEGNLSTFQYGAQIVTSIFAMPAVLSALHFSLYTSARSGAARSFAVTRDRDHLTGRFAIPYGCHRK